jgi:hypothetical protein
MVFEIINEYRIYDSKLQISTILYSELVFRKLRVKIINLLRKSIFFEITQHILKTLVILLIIRRVFMQIFIICKKIVLFN